MNFDSKTILSSKGYLLSKNLLSDDEVSKVRKLLQVEPISTFEQNSGYRPDNSFPIYKENSSRFRIPKFFGIKYFGLPLKVMKNISIPINVHFNGSLNEKTYQHIAVQKTLDALYKYPFGGGGILSLPPGFGKTTISLYVISKLSLKTLVIVHKEFLMNQWIERIKNFLPSASIGVIRQNKIDIDGKDIVLCMLQSISMKDYDNNIFSSFGFVVIDETHHICSKVFSRAFFKLQAKYCLGLSGTPHRKDGLTKVIEWFIGPIFYSIEREACSSVDVEVVRFQHDPSIVGSLADTPIVHLITNIINNIERTDIILDKLNSLFSQGRNIMILSERREHCFDLFNKIKNIHGVDSCGLYIGGMKQKDLLLSESKQIIIATFSLAHEGLDIPKLDSLILASPKGDVIQACGRILRETPGKKFNPYIVDIVDDVVIHQFKKRKSYYVKSGFNLISN